jgi:hypothetical protein
MIVIPIAILVALWLLLRPQPTDEDDRFHIGW